MGDLQIRGQRERPRVAVLGAWSEADQTALRAYFKTLWFAESVTALNGMVHTSELDLVLVGSPVEALVSVANHVHAIVFAEAELPGPVEGSVISYGRATGEEHLVDAPFSTALAGLRREIVDDTPHLRDRSIALLVWVALFGADYKESVATALYAGRALMTSVTPPGAHGFVFARERKGKRTLGCAWIPGARDRMRWIRALILEWSAFDPESFGTLADWESLAEWQTPAERELLTKLHELAAAREAEIARFTREENALRARFEAAREEASRATRRLLTAQEDDLVDAVSKALTSFGFEVEPIDEKLTTGKAKREDLRLRVKERSDWEAIAEVRGYEKRSAQVGDLLRLQRFATLYTQEKKRPPDKMYYFVNGQFGLPPDQRVPLLRGAADDVLVFEESGGLAVATPDLFRLLRDVAPEEARQLLL